MAASRRDVLLLLVLILAVSIAAAAYDAIPTTTVSGGGWMPVGRSACRGTIAECMGSEEFEMESESSRRILATSNYISYDSLKRDSVPCSRRGASYYNCRPGASGNPYTRGCSAITRCRS